MLNPEIEAIRGNKLPREKELEIEGIVTAKIKERQEKEFRELLREVNKEIKKRNEKE